MKNRFPRQSGVALVIVLGFLVLISVLIVAFFSSVTTELKASRNYSTGVTTRQLSESATQVVMGQIRSATTRTRAAWGSQPGMIRTYRQSASSAGPQADAFFKLYSSDKMVVTGSGELTSLVSGVDFATDWDKSPALWTDLNAPVLVDSAGNQVPRFPIIDPRAYYKTTDRNRTIQPKANDDPNEVNTEGFWYGSDTSFPTTPNGLVGPGTPNLQRLPMPVRWIYVLQDGTLTSPGDIGAGSSGMIAKWAAGSSETYQIPTKENPIVGRIAFWADDDSNKVNINTAGGFVDAELDPNLTSINYTADNYAGSFWDTPRFYTQFDRGMPYKESLGSSGSNKAGTPYPGGGGLAICQLLQNEFQRYPGHPSTTSLGLILGPYMKTPSGANAAYTRADQMYSVLPRLGIASNNGVAAGQQAGSTKGGIFRIIPSNPTTQANPVPQDLQIMPKGDRLYASVDELYFAAKSTDPANSASYSRITNDKFLQASANPLPASATALSAEHLEKLRFFLTAQSRSPELNLFGFPRITIWPVRFETATETSGLNPFDNVILFCSTIGVDPNQAATGRPNTMKAPSAAQSPLQTGLTPAPSGSNAGPPYRYIFTRRELPPATSTGVLPTPSASWGGSTTWLPDINQPRNKQLLVYLQRLTSQPIPGFGRAMTDKYSIEDRDQILTEIFDYIRCANLQDTTTRTIGQTTAIQFSSKGVVMPSKPTYLASGKTYTGFGRFPVISEATLVFYYAGPELWPINNTNPTAPTNPAKKAPAANGGDRNYSDFKTATGPQRAGMVKVDMDGYPFGRYMRAFLVFSFFNPMQGYAPTKDPASADPKIIIDVGADATGAPTANNLSKFMVNVPNGFDSWPEQPTDIYEGSYKAPVGTTSGFVTLGFPTGKLTTRIYRSSQGAWGGRNFGGFEGFMHTLIGNEGVSPVLGNKILEPNNTGPNGTGGVLLNPVVSNYTSNGSAISASSFNSVQEAYPFQSLESAKIYCPYVIPAQEQFPSDPTQKKTDRNPSIPGNKSKVPVGNLNTFDFKGGDLDVVVRYGGDYTTLGQVIQACTINFPDVNRLPFPKGDTDRDLVPAKRVGLIAVKDDYSTVPGADNSRIGGLVTSTSDVKRPLCVGVANGSAMLDLRNPLDTANPWVKILPTYTNGALFVNQFRRAYWDNLGSFYPYPSHGGTTAPSGWSALPGSNIDQSWAFARRLAWSMQPSHAPWRNSANTATLNYFNDRWKNIVQPGDTIRSVIYWKSVKGSVDTLTAKGPGQIKGGDLRLAMIPDPTTGKVPVGEYWPHPDYDTKADTGGSLSVSSYTLSDAPRVARATSLRLADGTPYFSPGASPSYAPYVATEDLITASAPTSQGGASEPTLGNHVKLNGSNRFPLSRAQGNLPVSAKNGTTGFSVNGVVRQQAGDPAGDFDTGIGSMPDGPYLNKPDEGNIIFAYQDPATQEWRYPVPYFGTWAYEQPGNTFTSPFRQMPSAGMFGSLLSRAATRRGWETLAFSPNPAGADHPGNDDPKDHLLLDLFNMPVVEPYPISEPFSSAGKVNLNYKIMPFGYIARSTALRAALHPTRVTAVAADAYYDKYKSGENSSGQSASGIAQYDVEKGQFMPIAANFRKVLDRDATIQGFDDFFAEGNSNPDKGFFKSASQVCERYLYPAGGGNTSDAAMKTWWSKQELGGDNTREKPYTDLYPRVTTKSNTFTVHMRVQTLRQIPRTAAADYAKWEEGRDSIVGEYRGASTIERYIDPADPRFDPTNTGNFVNPDDVTGATNLESIYRFRTVITKKFAPY